jgi:hypothetical protein
LFVHKLALYNHVFLGVSPNFLFNQGPGHKENFVQGPGKIDEPSSDHEYFFTQIAGGEAWPPHSNYTRILFTIDERGVM